MFTVKFPKVKVMGVLPLQGKNHMSFYNHVGKVTRRGGGDFRVNFFLEESCCYSFHDMKLTDFVAPGMTLLMASETVWGTNMVLVPVSMVARACNPVLIF